MSKDLAARRRCHHHANATGLADVTRPAGPNSDSVCTLPRSFEFSVESPPSVEQIHSAFSEKDYWLAAALDSFDIDTDGP